MKILIDIEEICNTIDSLSTRLEVKTFLDSIKLTISDLKSICKHYGINCTGNKNQIKQKIIENTIGAKLKFDGLLNINLK